MLSKVSYKKVVKGLDHFRKQHEEDRKDNPNAIPIDWKSSLLMMIERILRENHERYNKDTGFETLEYLVQQNLLVRYHGGYTFPGCYIPSIQEIQDVALRNYKK